MQESNRYYYGHCFCCCLLYRPNITPGGPESFTGLPGMILVSPSQNEYYLVRNKAEMIEVKDVDAMAPKKGRRQIWQI
jgi:hypothetical protein